MTDELTATEKIILALNELQEIHGMTYLTYDVCGCHDVAWVRAKVHALASRGHCTVETATHGGRGHKTIIRRNRNSPGAPRRTRKGRRS